MLYDFKVFQKVYDFLLWVKPTVQRFERVHKYSLGIQLENTVIEFMKKIVKANFVRENKKEFIEECLMEFEMVKILIRLAKDFKVLNLKQYEFASKNLNEIGRLLGGWYKRFS